MARPLRDRNPDYYHLVTVRTLEARIWMVPSEKLNSVIGGILARYQEIYDVIVYAYSILGNHLHLLVKVKSPNLDQFMENVLREIARRINFQVRRRGYFWSRRYDDQVILSDDDLLEAFLYVVTNPVKHGLVVEARAWPGLSCYHQLFSDRPSQYTFVHYSQTTNRGKPFVSFHKLTLSSLPQFQWLPKSTRDRKIRSLISTREKELVTERREAGKGFCGARAIRTQPVGRTPVEVAYSPRPICYTKDPAVRHRYRAERKVFRAIYNDASEEFRAGNLAIDFPPYCFKPPLHRPCGRIVC